MRFVGLLLASTLLATPAFAGKDPCKGVSVKKDAFGETRSFEAGDLRLKKSGDTWNFTIKFNVGGGLGGFTALSFNMIPAGSTVQLALADGSVVDLTSSANATTQTTAVMGVVVQYLEIPMSVTPDQIKALTAQDIKAARLIQNDSAVATSEFKSGDASKFKATAACMIGS
jgi:hypothetical protein